MRAKSPSFVGLQGIVIVETTYTFKIITKENKLKSMFCVFVFVVHLSFKVHSDTESEHSVFVRRRIDVTKAISFFLLMTLPIGFFFSSSIVDHRLVQLFGNQFCQRPAERAVKKFKTKPSVDL